VVPKATIAIPKRRPGNTRVIIQARRWDNWFGMMLMKKADVAFEGRVTGLRANRMPSF
jgi:hypothetical protein